MSHDIYDIIGIGIGPFNLGLAALGSSIPGLRMRFFERQPDFDWHPGMLIEGSSLQVSFLADLVTTVDPCNPLSFLSYLKQSGRLYQFAIRDNSFMSRKEYNCYCKWAVSRLGCFEFGTEVIQTRYDDDLQCYRVETWCMHTARRQELLARNVVLGVGTAPSMPACVPRQPLQQVLHSSQYMPRRLSVLGCRSVALVGSGQSAAEIFYDLLQSKSPETVVTWLTRAERFFPMDYSKLSLELASPGYIDHFFRLPTAVKAGVLERQDPLYKGINLELINRIYDLLYERSCGQPPEDVFLATSCELERVDSHPGALTLGFRQRELDQTFEHRADALILATGYDYRVPECIEPLRTRIHWDEHGRFVVNRDYSVSCEPGGLFVQNAELHTHGFTAPDLSIGPYRNATILNTIVGREVFQLEKRIAFQDFGVPRLPSVLPERAPQRERKSGALRPVPAVWSAGGAVHACDLRMDDER